MVSWPVGPCLTTDSVGLGPPILRILLSAHRPDNDTRSRPAQGVADIGGRGPGDPRIEQVFVEQVFEIEQVFELERTFVVQVFENQ